MLFYVLHMIVMYYGFTLRGKDLWKLYLTGLKNPFIYILCSFTGNICQDDLSSIVKPAMF